MTHCLLWAESDPHPFPAAPELWVTAVPAHVAKDLARRHHYMHRRPSVSCAYGVCRADEVCGIVTFGVPASRNLQQEACPADPDAVIELNRLWLHDDLPRGVASWFLSRALHRLAPHIVVSYADTAAGHLGYVYRAANFHYAGWTDMHRNKPRLDYLPADPALHSRDAMRHGYAATARRRPKVRYWTTTGPPLVRRFLARSCAWPDMDWRSCPPPTAHRRL